MDSFDPFKVPTLRALVRQIDRYDQEHGGDEAAKSVPGTKRCCGTMGGGVSLHTYTREKKANGITYIHSINTPTQIPQTRRLQEDGAAQERGADGEDAAGAHGPRPQAPPPRRARE